MKRTSFLFLLLLTVFATTGMAQRGRRADRPVVFKVKKIYVGNDEVISPGMVLVKAGKIVAVGKSIEVPRGAVQVDRPNWTLTPGLIDAAAEGFGNSTEAISEVVAGFKVADGLNLGNKHFHELAKGGVTTAFVTGSNSAVIGSQGATVKMGKSPRVLNKEGDPKLTISHSAHSGNRGPSRFSGITVYTRRPTSQMGTIFVARDAMNKAKIYAAAKKAGKKVAADPHLDSLGHVLAGKKHLRIRGEQQYELSAGLRFAEEFGVKPVFENCVEAYRVIDMLKAQKAAVVMGPVKPNPQAAPAGRFGRRRPQPKMNPAGAAKVAKAGVTMALTAGSGRGEAGLARQAAYAVRHGLSLVDAVKATTSVPAKLLGFEKKIGMVKAGFEADFVLWTGEPFSATSKPGMVLIDGSVVRGQSY